MPLDSKSSHQRRYGFACTACRSRKIKCDGEKPQCRRCVRASLQCTYQVADPSAARLRSELARSRTRIHELEEGIKAVGLASSDERERRIRELVSSCTNSSTIRPRSESENVDAGDTGDLNEKHVEDDDDNDDDNDVYDENKIVQAEVSVEEDGSVSHSRSESSHNTKSFLIGFIFWSNLSLPRQSSIESPWRICKGY